MNQIEAMPREYIWVFSIGIGLALLLGILFYPITQAPAARRVLPEGVTDVKEYQTGSLTKDTSCHILKARLPETMQNIYAQRLGLKERYSSKVSPSLNMAFRVGGAPQWWDPPGLKEGAFYKVTSEQWNEYEMLGYKDGYVYYIHAKWPLVKPSTPTRTNSLSN